MSGGEASIRIGMQNAGLRNPPGQERGEPCTDFGRAMMLPAPKPSLNNFQLRDHPLLRRDPPDDQSSVGELPTELGEAQECEGLSGLPTILEEYMDDRKRGLQE
jgi:hypothetical protein